MTTGVLLRHTTTTGTPNHAEVVERIHAAAIRPPAAPVRLRAYSDESVELHELGEFPMDCYRCHVHINVEDRSSLHRTGLIPRG